MGSMLSVAAPPPTAAPTQATNTETQQAPANAMSGGCPHAAGQSNAADKMVQHAQMAQNKEQKMTGTVAQAALSGGCPQAAAQAQGLDPSNNMYPPNQMPHPEQTAPLSRDRVTSSIPKSEKENQWVYPSPQMFFNAMKRKGWEPKEQDMDVVVAIHNNVNERTWEKIRAWESLHPETTPTLVRFSGRPDDLTPKAWFRYLTGREKPFDRHDWIVGRDGKEVRYVIDFYAYDPSNGMPPTTLIDARPALDSVESFLDRFRMRYYVLRQRYWPIRVDPAQIAGPAQNQQSAPSQPTPSAAS
eukprot:comp6015_c0_seq1/m.1861 comp6015_c0_seq1/g.1861  ORF comp6015_c0_seq1/g.1861 comp6015_c0_seq1/m.1861 type:complete len:300 (-) comp6015_c0_seq1:126-1025(-)